MHIRVFLLGIKKKIRILIDVTHSGENLTNFIVDVPFSLIISLEEEFIITLLRTFHSCKYTNYFPEGYEPYTHTYRCRHLYTFFGLLLKFKIYLEAILRRHDV